MLTKKQVNKEHNGVLRFEHVDSLGSKFVLLLFTIGNLAIVRVYRGENYERLVYSNALSYEKFRQAAEVFENAKERILDEQNNHWLHKRFAK